MSFEGASGGCQDIPVEQHSSQETEDDAERQDLAHAGVAIKT
jgi:hypothetical protein